MTDPFERERRKEDLEQALERLPTRLSWVRSRVGFVLTIGVGIISLLGLLMMLFYVFFGWVPDDPVEWKPVANIGMALLAGGLLCLILLQKAFPYKAPETIEAVQKQWAEQDRKDDIRWETRRASAGALTEASETAKEGQLSVSVDPGSLSAEAEDDDA